MDTPLDVHSIGSQRVTESWQVRIAIRGEGVKLFRCISFYIYIRHPLKKSKSRLL